MSCHATLRKGAKRLARCAAVIGAWFALELVLVSTTLASPPVFVFSTFLGGADGEQLAAVAADAAGDVYVAGTAHQNSPPLAKMLVAKYSTEGALLWSRTIDFADRLGVVHGAAVTPDGGLCVVGSSLPPSPGQLSHRLGPGGDLDGLIVFLSADGAVESATYLGEARSTRSTALRSPPTAPLSSPAPPTRATSPPRIRSRPPWPGAVTPLLRC